jgi:cell division protein FtsL
VSIITSILTLIAIAVINKIEIHQMDIKITFLNSNIEEEVYME